MVVYLDGTVDISVEVATEHGPTMALFAILPPWFLPATEIEYLPAIPLAIETLTGVVRVLHLLGVRYITLSEMSDD